MSKKLLIFSICIIAIIPASTALLIGNQTEGVEAFHFSSAGVGTKYSPPSVSAGSLGDDVVFLKDGSAVFVATNTLSGYPWNSSSGFGTRFTNPSGVASLGVLSAGVLSVDGSVLIVSGNTSPRLWAVPVSSAGFGTLLTAPASPPANQCADLILNTSGNILIAIAQNAAAPATYTFSSATGIGAQTVSPNAASAPIVNSALSPQNDVLMLAVNGGDFVDAYHFSAAGIGAKYATLTGRPGQRPNAIAFSPDGNYVLMAVASVIQVYTFNKSTGALQTVGSPVAGGINMRRIRFSPDGQFVCAVYSNVSPFFNVWPWTGSGLGAPLSQVAVSLSVGRSCAFSPN